MKSAARVSDSPAELPELASVSPKPQWAIDAGFANRLEAARADCFETNAHQFRDGERDPFATWPDGRIESFFDSEPPPVNWFCDRRLLAGRGHLLAGVGGSSKTRIMYHLGVGSVVGGLPWSWDVSVTGSAALFLTEDVAGQVHRTMHQMGQLLEPSGRALLAQRLRVYPLAGKRAMLLELNGNALNLTHAYDWMMRQIDALPKPVAFIGIDPALGVTEGDELNPAHQRRLGELIDHIGIESGACAMLSAHAIKGIHQAEELNSHSSRGSGAITDAVRGEFVVRNMTADEARRFGVTDIAERKAYLQLAAVKGNELPPEAYAPVWLKRSASGGLQEVTLDQVEAGTVGKRELQALELLKATAPQGDTSMKFWREQCVAAGVIVKGGSTAAQEKAMERIRDTLKDAGLVVKGCYRGSWAPI